MAPEQARGEAVDARADVFSAGVVLAEMVAAGGRRNAAAREAVWRAVHDEPPRLDDTPWAAVLRKAVADAREQRYSTAAALSRALDEVTLRTSGRRVAAAVSRPGVVHRAGRGLLRRPRARDRGDVEEAAAAASARADRSFRRRQELVPARGARRRARRPGWRVVFATPGNRPFAALAHALAPELSGDVRGRRAADRLRAAGRRGRGRLPLAPPARSRPARPRSVRGAVHAEPAGGAGALRAAARRLALDADVHVLLSMRDDFLFHCQQFREPGPALLRTHGHRPAHRRRPAPGARPAGAQVRLSLRGRSDGRRDAGRGRGRARRPAARRLCHVAALGSARSRARIAHASGLPARSAALAARWRSMPKRRSSASDRIACRSSASCFATW